MEIAKQFQKASIEDIEAHIERLANERDGLNKDLVALNQLRDAKAREKEKQKAAAEFERKYGAPPAQTIQPASAVGEAQVPRGFMDSLLELFGGGKKP